MKLLLDGLMLGALKSTMLAVHTPLDTVDMGSRHPCIDMQTTGRLGIQVKWLSTGTGKLEMRWEEPSSSKKKKKSSTPGLFSWGKNTKPTERYYH
jgi:hypothetical protein